MTWFVLSLLTAFFHSIKDIVSKHTLRGLNEYVVAVGMNLFALPFLVLALSVEGLPSVAPVYWKVLIATCSIDAIGVVLYLRALKLSDISLSVPMMSFTPLFVLVASPIIVSEFPGALGVLGVFLIVLGSWTLNLRTARSGLLAPFQALITEPGPRIMLLVAFLWSITSNLHKVGILASSPMLYTVGLVAGRGFLIFLLMLYYSDARWHVPLRRVRELCPIGLLASLVLICQMIAIKMTLVANVISIKRLSIVFSVFLGHLIFREANVRERFGGALLMVLGTMCIAFS